MIAWVRLAALMAVFVVLVLAGCAIQQAAPSESPTTTSSPAATVSSPPTGSPAATTTQSPATVEPSQGAFPATMLGLPVISVAQAQQLANVGKLDGRLVAVGGYWNQFALPCPFMPHQALMAGFCLGSEFADTAEAVTGYNGGNFPNAPISAPETASGDLLWSTSGDAPAAVVLIVHAGDSRAWQCLSADRATCQTRMVIDSVAWFNGSATQLALPGGDIAPKLSLSDMAGMAAKSEQLVTAYPMLATQLNDVDPRFLGQASGIVWYLRLAKTPSGTDGINDGVVRLVSDESATVIDELPMVVASDYQPARVILDADAGSSNSQNSYPQYSVTAGADVLSADTLGMSTAPIALEPGSYQLHAFLGDPNGQPTGGPKCDLSLDAKAGTNVAYQATFTAGKCDWATEQSQF